MCVMFDVHVCVCVCAARWLGVSQVPGSVPAQDHSAATTTCVASVSCSSSLGQHVVTYVLSRGHCFLHSWHPLPPLTLPSLNLTLFLCHRSHSSPHSPQVRSLWQSVTCPTGPSLRSRAWPHSTGCRAGCQTVHCSAVKTCWSAHLQVSAGCMWYGGVEQTI